MGQSPGKARVSAWRATGKTPLSSERRHTQKRFNRFVAIKIFIYTLFGRPVRKRRLRCLIISTKCPRVVWNSIPWNQNPEKKFLLMTLSGSDAFRASFSLRLCNVPERRLRFNSTWEQTKNWFRWGRAQLHLQKCHKLHFYSRVGVINKKWIKSAEFSQPGNSFAWYWSHEN